MEWRGFLDEPYCSMGCKLIGGTEAIQALMAGLSGDCLVCGKTVTASPTVNTCTVIPFGGRLGLVCADDIERGKALVASAAVCSRCNAGLD
jgi:hypothetical protein